jgi:predicted XRE-type DNA-binding protein
MVPSFRIVPDTFGKYRVDSRGNVWRLKKSGWKKLIPNVPKRSGYARVTLSVLGKVKRWSVHNLILICFKGLRPLGKECRHLDGNKKNNRPYNLKWGTKQENYKDRVKHGMGNHGERHGEAKLTDALVKEIYQLVKSEAMSRVKISRKYGVTDPIISGIARGVFWKHLGLKPILFKDQVRVRAEAIRKEYANGKGGVTQLQLGNKYGLCQVAVSSIVRYRICP